jgi:hypothetical protein
MPSDVTSQNGFDGPKGLLLGPNRSFGLGLNWPLLLGVACAVPP